LSLICFKEEKSPGAIQNLLVALFSKILSKDVNQYPHLAIISLILLEKSRPTFSLWYVPDLNSPPECRLSLKFATVKVHHQNLIHSP
jgi:hypothetical protein